MSSGVEIGRIQPACKSHSQGRPFLVDHRIPRCIPIAPLHYRRLTEDALERQTKALSCGA